GLRDPESQGRHLLPGVPAPIRRAGARSHDRSVSRPGTAVWIGRPARRQYRGVAHGAGALAAAPGPRLRRLAGTRDRHHPGLARCAAGPAEAAHVTTRSVSATPFGRHWGSNLPPAYRYFAGVGDSHWRRRMSRTRFMFGSLLVAAL